ncbi:ABC transporter ATP-binding protein [Spiroplasma chinense]|uniref:ABC transporter ATP-binding protein n=1 Tax=Spiroplasma chinense TaxID=216932 RepID=A0A5B9Y654_9MOLU|nr:ABC transporter ATP-binding protein [Spiroplasma chinense]QEH62335.1 ABC transporter ATP-binding protein [Spiroplasma chinense]
MIEIKDLSKVFKNGAGIKNINLSINPGEICAILGPNGAGKSTLLKTIFKEYIPNFGEITFNNQTDNYLNNFSFFTDQSLFPKGVAIEFFCRYTAELVGVKPNEAKKRTKYLLDKLELSKYAKKTFASLSAGMQKKAMLAASLINEPECIFLDEPTANLDIESRRAMINLLQQMKNEGKTIVITSHIIDELQNIVDHAVVLKEGKIVYDKKFDNKKEKLEDIYFMHTDSKKAEDKFGNLTNFGEEVK